MEKCERQFTVCMMANNQTVYISVSLVHHWVWVSSYSWDWHLLHLTHLLWNSLIFKLKPSARFIYRVSKMSSLEFYLLCVHRRPKQSDCGQFGCPSHREGPGGPLWGGSSYTGRRWRSHAGRTQGGTKDVSVLFDFLLTSLILCHVLFGLLFHNFFFLYFEM